MASLPYPRRPPNSFHRTHSKFVCASPPTDFTEFTEVSSGGYSPTEFTEYTEASGGGYSPTEFTEFTEVSDGGYSPTDFTEYTEASGGEEPPTDFTDVHRFFFSASRFCVFREFCGKIVWWLPYPRRPPNSFHRTHSKFVYASPPTEFTEFTEVSGGEEPPTDCTDAHRWFGCAGFSHRLH